MKVQIEEKKLTEKQRQECLEKAKQELDEVVLGENESLEHVDQSLYLPETLQEGPWKRNMDFLIMKCLMQKEVFWMGLRNLFW